MKRLRIIMIGIICICIITSGSFIQIQTKAATSTIVTFEQYKANESIHSSLIEFYLSDRLYMPYHEQVEKNRSSLTYQTLINAWQISTFELDNVVDYSKKRVGYYESFLFDIIYEGNDPDNLTGQMEKIIKSVQSSSMKKLCKLSGDNISDYAKMNIASMTSEQKDLLVEGLLSCPELSEIFGAINNVENVLKYATKVEELVYKLAKVHVIRSMIDQYSDILLYISNNTDDRSLRVACDELAAICKDEIDESWIITALSSDMVATELSKYVLSKVWTGVVEKMTGYGIAVSVGQKLGKWTSHLLFSTDEEIETYYEMSALYDFEKELKKAISYYKKNYQQVNTHENAMVYNTSIDMLLKVYNLGMDISVKYGSNVYEKGACNLFISNVIGNKEKFDDFKRHTVNIQNELKMLLDYRNSILYSQYLDDQCQDVWAEIDMPIDDNIITNNDIENARESLEKSLFICCSQTIKGNLTLNYDMETYGDIELISGTLDLNGHRFIVNGNFTTSDKESQIKINEGSLDVKGDLIIGVREINENGEETIGTSRAYITMRYPQDKLRVRGDFIYSGYGDRANLQDGTFYVEGDFSVLRCGNFYPASKHTIVFCGNDRQKIDYYSSQSGFANVRFNNPNIEIVSKSISGFSLQDDINLITPQDYFKIYNTPLDLNGHKITIEGNFVHSYGNVNINGGELDIDGDYILAFQNSQDETKWVSTSSAKLEMSTENDVIRIGGNFVNNSGDYRTSNVSLQAGKMYLKGDFSNLSSETHSFYQSKEHTLIFNGEKRQKIYFYRYSNVGFTNVRFFNPNIEFTSDISGFTLQDDINMVSPQKFWYIYGSIDLNGHKINVNQDFIQSNGNININGGELDIKGDYIIGSRSYDVNGQEQIHSSSSTTYIKMTNPEDIVRVNGRFIYNATMPLEPVLTDGAIHLKGDFYVPYAGSDSSFRSLANHTVIFEGAKRQKIYFLWCGKYSQFAKVRFINPNIEFTSDIPAFTLQDDINLKVPKTGFKIYNGKIDLNGHKITVDGDFIHSGGSIYISGGELDISGDYIMASVTQSETGPEYSYCNAGLKMFDENDIVRIGKRYINYTSDYDTYLTNGVIYLKGDFYQLIKSHHCFEPTDLNTVVFEGNTRQKIHFAGYSESNGFSNVRFINPDIEITSDIRGFVLHDDVNLIVPHDNFNINGTINLNGHKMNIIGDLVQNGGTLNINGGELDIHGDYLIAKRTYDEDQNEVLNSVDAYLQMQNVNDVVRVEKRFIDYSNKSMRLTAGTMYIQGDFEQRARTGNTSGYYNFAASGNHTVILDGKDVQNVFFEWNYSSFNNLKLTKDKDTGYVFNPDNCWKNLYVDTDIEKVSIDAETFTAIQGHSLQFSAVVSGMNNPSQQVDWVISGQKAKETTITKEGLLNVDWDETAEKIVVTAISTQDPSIMCNKEIQIEKAIPVVKSVNISPKLEFVTRGKSYTFSVSISGENRPTQETIWSLAGNTSENTSLSSEGILYVDTEEKSNRIQLLARSKLSPEIFDMMDLLIINDGSYVDEVVIDDKGIKMELGGEKTFTATVTGFNNPIQECKWTIEGNLSEETCIDQTGILKISENETAKSVIIKATSIQDTTKYASVVVTIYTDHIYREEIIKNSSCTSVGQKSLTCEICGHSYTEEISILHHEYKEVIDSEIAPTCVQEGKKANSKCTLCGDEIIGDIIPATGHQNTQLKNKKEASCKETGYTGDIYCMDCKTVINSGEEIAKKSHNIVDDYAVSATCTKDGRTAGKHCSTCNTVFEAQETLKAYGHDYQLVEGSSVDATCTVNGKESDEKCSRCQDVKSGAVIKANGHIWDEGFIVKEANCTTVGEKLFTCSKCDTSKTVGIPVTDHTYTSVSAKATLTTSGFKAQKCTVCKNEKDKVIYSYPKTIALSKTAYVYTAKVIKPTVTVKGADGKVISANNYTLTYSNAKSTNVGKYTVKITFKGNYSGSTSLTYKINPKSTTISGFTPASKAFTVKWAKMTTQTTGYQIQYATVNTFSSAVTKTVTKNTTVNLKCSSLKAKKKYYVRVRTYKTISGVKYYSAWSPVKTVTTK